MLNIFLSLLKNLFLILRLSRGIFLFSIFFVIFLYVWLVSDLELSIVGFFLFVDIIMFLLLGIRFNKFIVNIFIIFCLFIMFLCLIILFLILFIINFIFFILFVFNRFIILLVFFIVDIFGLVIIIVLFVLVIVFLKFCLIFVG